MEKFEELPEIPADGKLKHFCIPIFNRATYGRTKELLSRLSDRARVNITVVLSSSLLMEEFGNPAEYIVKGHEKIEFKLIDVLKPDYTHLGMLKSAADITVKLGEFIAEQDFTAVLVIGDRYETLPAAMAAAYQNVPVIHLQGGEVTGNIDDKVRHAVTKLADFHFVCTEMAKKYVLEMGEEQYRVFFTGCPSIDFVRKQGFKRYVGNANRPKLKYFMCIYHPETAETEVAYERTKIVLEAVLRHCSDKGGKCYWYWPNPDPGRAKILDLLENAYKEAHPYIVKVVNTPPEEFIEQLAGCRFIIGNSSAGIRESSWLGVPAINIGHRQSWRERSFNVIDVGYDVEEIYKTMDVQEARRGFLKSFLFGDGNASKRIAQHMERLEFDTKGPLGYPESFKFRHDHFGEKRNNEHRKQRVQPYEAIRKRKYIKQIYTEGK